MLSNERSNAWALNNISAAVAVVPANDVQATCIKRISEHGAKLYKQSLDYLPSGSPGFFSPGSTGGNSPWFEAWIGMFAYTAYRRTKDANYLALAYEQTKMVMRPYNLGKMPMAQQYHVMSRPRQFLNWEATTNPWLAEPFELEEVSAIATNGTFTFTPYMGATFANGDRVMISDINNNASNQHAQKIPELSYGTVYYMRNVTANTFQLTTTAGSSGGTIITFAASKGTHVMGFNLASYARMTPFDPGQFGNEQQSIWHYMLAVEAYRHGHPDVTLAVVNAYRTFLAGTLPLTNNVFPQWAIAP
jgi:hypothetical protein